MDKFDQKRSLTTSNLEFTSLSTDMIFKHDSSKPPFVPYTVQFSANGQSKGETVKVDGKTNLEESWPMNNIRADKIEMDTTLNLPRFVLNNLNPAQIDTVILAQNRFRHFIETKDGPKRAGILIADAAGVGKGRSNAAIVLNESHYVGGLFPKGRRAVIVTLNENLINDYYRDFKDLIREGIELTEEDVKFARLENKTNEEYLEEKIDKDLKKLLKPFSYFKDIRNLGNGVGSDCILIMTYHELKRNLRKKIREEKDEDSDSETETDDDVDSESSEDSVMSGVDTGQVEEKGNKGKIRRKRKGPFPNFEGTSDTEFDDIMLEGPDGYTDIETDTSKYMGIYVVKKFLQDCPDAVVILDESHHAKNAHEHMEYNQSEAGRAVLKLQRILPKAKFVYSSATAATYPHHLGNMTRLGLWGKDCYHKGFKDYCSNTKQMDSSAFIPLWLKQNGAMVSRQLSMNDINFEILKVPKNAANDLRHSFFVRQWVFLLTDVFTTTAAYLANAEDRHLFRTAYSAIWNEHVRFFKCLIVDTKIDTIVEKTIELIEDGNSVVIGAFSTGDASLQRINAAGNELTGFISTLREIMVNTVITLLNPSGRKQRVQDYIVRKENLAQAKKDRAEKKKKEALEKEKRDEERRRARKERAKRPRGKKVSQPAVPNVPVSNLSDTSSDENEDAPTNNEKLVKANNKNSMSTEEFFLNQDGPPDGYDPEAFFRIKKWIKRINEYDPTYFAPNFLDNIIHKLKQKGYDVAELTGRKLVVREVGGKFNIINRVEADFKKGCGSSNLMEQEIKAFNSGEKRVAIVSDASSTGISLHCRPDLPKERQYPRVQILAELSWSADRVLQVMGRVHRTNQTKPPKYIFVESPYSAEIRFISTARGRLHSMASLTSGQSSTLQGEKLLNYNYNNITGRMALEKVMEEILLKWNAYRKNEPQDSFYVSEVDDIPDIAKKLTGGLTPEQCESLHRFYDIASDDVGDGTDRLSRSFLFQFLTEFKIFGVNIEERVGKGLRKAKLTGADYFKRCLNRLLGCTPHTSNSFFRTFKEVFEPLSEACSKVSCVVIDPNVFNVYINSEDSDMRRCVYNKTGKVQLTHGPCSLMTLHVTVGTALCAVQKLYRQMLEHGAESDFRWGFYVDRPSRGKQLADYYVYVHELSTPLTINGEEFRFQLHQSCFLPKYLTNEDMIKLEGLFDRVPDEQDEIEDAREAWKNQDGWSAKCIDNNWFPGSCRDPCCKDGSNKLEMVLFTGDVFAGLEILTVSLQIENPIFVVTEEKEKNQSICGFYIPNEHETDFQMLFEGLTPKSFAKKVKVLAKKPSKSVLLSAETLKAKPVEKRSTGNESSESDSCPSLKKKPRFNKSP